MPWARFDDQFYANHKVLAMSNEAFRLFVVSIVYCRSQRENCGYVSTAVSKSLCGMHRVKFAARKELEECGCWEPVRDGWLIHDFDQYVEKTSTERMRKHRETKRLEASHETFHQRSQPSHETSHQRHMNVTSVSHFSRAQGPEPVPEPVPDPKNSAPSGAALRARDAEFNNLPVADVIALAQKAASKEAV